EDLQRARSPQPIRAPEPPVVLEELVDELAVEVEAGEGSIRVLVDAPDERRIEEHAYDDALQRDERGDRSVRIAGRAVDEERLLERLPAHGLFLDCGKSALRRSNVGIVAPGSLCS